MTRKEARKEALDFIWDKLYKHYKVRMDTKNTCFIVFYQYFEPEESKMFPFVIEK